MEWPIVRQILTALILGLAIGMQRSLSRHGSTHGNFGGSRTFALIALAGYLSAWLSESFAGIVWLAGGWIALLSAVSYGLKIQHKQKWGMTGPVTAVATFLLGVMIRKGWLEYAVFIGVLIIVLLEIKPFLKSLESRIGPREVHSGVLLLAMTFVILPLLPDRTVDPWHLFNPYQTWLMAVIIAAISFAGYISVKLLGQRHGVFLTGAAGGLASSTGVSITLSKMFPRSDALIPTYAGGIAIACTFMYLRVLFEAFVVHPALAWKLLPAYLGAALSGLAFSYWLYRRSRSGPEVRFDNPAFSKNPLQLSEAIKFGILFGVIYGAVTLVKQRYGDLGVYLVSFFSGLTDVDAITLSLSQMAGSGKLQEFPAMTGIVIASVTNSIVKLGIVYWLGGWRLGWKLTEFFILTLGLMGLGLYLGQFIH